VYGQHQDVSAHHWTHLGPAVREKKTRHYKLRTHCWFNPDLVSFKHYKFKVSCPCKEYIRVSQSKLTNSWVQYWVKRLVTKHFKCSGAGWIQGEVSIVFGIQTKLEPLLLMHLAHETNQKWNRIEKVTSLQSTRGQ